MWGLQGPTDREQLWYDKFMAIISHIRKYIYTNRKAMKLHEISNEEVAAMVQLQKIDPIYYKVDKETGERVKENAPVLSVKLITYKPKDKKGAATDKKDIIRSYFTDAEGNKLDAYDLLGQKCHAKAAVKIESVYIGGGRFALQLKLVDAIIERTENSNKPLLNRSNVARTVVATNSTNMNDSKDDDDDKGSVEDDDDEVVEPPKEAPKPAPIRKIVNKPKAKAT
jgi:hypothetical protein